MDLFLKFGQKRRFLVEIYRFKKEIQKDDYKLTGKNFLRQIIQFPRLEDAREASIELLDITYNTMNKLKHNDTKKKRYEDEAIYINRVKTNIEELQAYFTERGDTDKKVEFKKQMKGLYIQNVELENKKQRQDSLPSILSFEKEEYQNQIDKLELALDVKINDVYENKFKEVFIKEGFDLDMVNEENHGIE